MAGAKVKITISNQMPKHIAMILLFFPEAASDSSIVG
jgi:hypothetical protein